MRNSSDRTHKVINIYNCYAHDGEAYLDKLEEHLSPLKREGLIATWDERKIQPGAEEEREIDVHLRASDIILLFVSSGFLASEHCYDIQQRAIRLHEANNLVVIPVILHHANWKQTEIGKFKPLPTGEKPISDWRSRDKAYKDVADGIYVVFKELQSQLQKQANVKEEFVFFGEYPVEGYRWDTDLRPAPGLVDQGITLEAPWLIARPVGIEHLARQYSPFEEKNLFRDFASLSSTPEAIKQFADTHGYLGEPVPLYNPHKVGQPDSVLWVGESLRLWQQEIEEMGILVSLWEMIRERQVEMLMEHIIWHRRPRGVRFEWHFSRGTRQVLIASERLPREQRPKREPLYLWKFGEVINPALDYLCTQINQRLTGHANPTLFPFPRREMYTHLDSLLSALYVLLAMEVREHPVDPETTP